MSKEQDNTAILAIVIALIAFFVTTAQLLQALFGTAVGYRQCQSSVIGEWAKKTRRKWRWSEFRFETIFTTPNIQLDALMVEQDSDHVGVFITGDVDSRRETYSTEGSKRTVWGRRFGWLALTFEHSPSFSGTLLRDDYIWSSAANKVHSDSPSGRKYDLPSHYLSYPVVGLYAS